MPLKPLTLSLVEYEEGDIIGKAMAIVSLSHLFIATAMATLGLSTRDLRVSIAALGEVSLLC